MGLLSQGCDRCGHGAERHYSGSSPECQERGGNFCAALDCRCRGFRAAVAAQDEPEQISPQAGRTPLEQALVDDLRAVGQFIWDEGTRAFEQWKNRLVAMVGAAEVLPYAEWIWREITGMPVPEPAIPDPVLLALARGARRGGGGRALVAHSDLAWGTADARRYQRTCQ